MLVDSELVPLLVIPMRNVPDRSHLAVHGFGLERFVHGLLLVQAGTVAPPRRPSHGVGCGWEALELHRVQALDRRVRLKVRERGGARQ